MMKQRMIRKAVLAALMLLTLLFAHSSLAFASDPIGSGALHVLGVGLAADPSHQNAPVNTGTAVNTKLVMPNIDFGGGIGTPSDFLVVAELTGPGITNPITISARPGAQLVIPPLPQEGTYILDKIRLMSGDVVILYADPSMAMIDTIKKILITQVVSRPLSLSEIESLGITINPSNFTAYKFTVGFGTETGTVKMDIPVVMDRRDDIKNVTDQVAMDMPPQFASMPQLKVPNFQVKGFQMEIKPEEVEDLRFIAFSPPIAGAVVIPGDVGFLNQFFEVLLMVTNNAPTGSNLIVSDISAQIYLPAGKDNIPSTLDDPLRIAATNNGTASKVPVIASGGGSQLSGQQSGQGRFLVEGLREGTHQVNIDISGTLLGLPSGPIKISGKAAGTVVVRNPKFSFTFGHPDVVRDGEKYSLYITINNTSTSDANLVSLTLYPGDISGATMVSDSDPGSPLGMVKFETIRAGDSAVAEFRFIARKTGKVTSTAFVGDEGVNGVFRLRTGIGDSGIPLSPDSIVVPQFAENLPSDLLFQAIRLLGLAHSVSTAPSLPPGVTRISKYSVVLRAYELAEAGLRIRIGEPVQRSVSDLVMDWLGNGQSDTGLAELIRTTEAGRDFLFEAGRIIGNGEPLDMQRVFGDVVKYRQPFISAVIDNRGASSAAFIEISNSAGKSFGRRADGSIITDMPSGFVLDMDGDPALGLRDMAIVNNTASGDVFDLKIKGVASGLINFGLIFPDQYGGFSQATYKNIAITAGETITARIVASAQAPVLRKGQSDINASDVYTYPANAGPRPIGAMQLSEGDMRDRGRVVVVLFDEKIKPESANNPKNYEVVYRTLSRRLINPPEAVKILPGGRIIEIMFKGTISPFFEYDLKLSGITDPYLNMQEPPLARIPIVTTLTTPGGIISGTVRKGNGDPIPYTEVQLSEMFIDDEGYPFRVITNLAMTDAAGSYQIDYATLNREGFSVSSSDPETGQQGSMTSQIIMDRQHLRLDILLLGLGTLTGQVVRAEDNLPLPGARVTVSSLTSGGSVFETNADASGKFIMKMVPVGILNIRAKYGYYEGAIAATMPLAGSSVDTLVPAYNMESTGKVNGRVFEADLKTPISKVPVIVRGDRGYTNWMYSDANGSFSFDRVPTGSIDIESFRQETGERVTMHSSVTYNAVTTINLIYPGNAGIVGSVVNFDGTPVAGADVISGINLVKTDQNGSFAFEKVPLGDVEVKAQHPVTLEIATSYVQIANPGEVARVNIIFPEPKKTGTIQGYVRNASGKAIMGQRVILMRGDVLEKSTSTDGNGFFKVSDLDMGGYSVRTVNNELTDGDMKTVSLVVDKQTITIDLNLKGFGKVMGTVYGPDGVSPVVASIIFTRTRFTGIGSPYYEQVRYVSDQLTNTGLSGKYVIDAVRVGDFRLEASNAFYSQPVVKVGKITSPDETQVIDIVMIPTSTVRGQVYLANGEKAPKGLTVTMTCRTISGIQAITRDDGTFVFTLVPPEGFTLTVYDPMTGNYGISRGSVETGDEADVDIRLLGKGTVKVKVINGSGDPLSGVKITLNSGSAVAHLMGGFPHFNSDQNGEAEFQNVPEGPYSVTGEDTRTMTGGKAGGTMPTDQAVINTTVIVGASGTVSGTIYTADGLGVVPYAQVMLTSASRPAFYTTSDSEGKFSFTYVPLISFTLNVFHPGTGRIGSASGIVHYDTEEVTVDVMLIAQGTVEGYVYTASGRPVSKANVVINSGSGSIVMTSNLEGRFKASGISAGSFTVTATDLFTRLTGSATGNITSEGELVRTNVYLQPTGQIKGRTLSADGAAVPYAIVSLSNGRSATTDVDGNFSFDLLTLGSYSISAREQNGWDGGQGAASLSYEGQVITVDIVFIGTGSIEGKVVRADGQPLGTFATLSLTRTGALTNYFTGYSDLVGNFQFTGIPLGNFSISAKLPGSILGGVYGGTLSGDGTVLRNVVVVIEDSGQIHGKVFRQDGVTPCRDAVIYCYLLTADKRGFSLYAVSAADGSFSFTEMPFGSFSLSVTDYSSGGSGRASGVINAAADSADVGTIVLDEAAPYVVSIVPVSGSSQVPLDSVIVATFSEPIRTSSLNSSTIRVVSGSSVLAGTLTISNDRKSVTMKPAAKLPEFSSITVSVASIVDDAGKVMSGTTKSLFTTADITPPSVRSARLIKGAFVMEFSEAVKTGTESITVTNTVTGSAVAGSVMYSAGNLTATFSPSSPLQDDIVYMLRVSGLSDGFGNIQTTVFTASYLTGDKQPPTISLSATATTVIEGTSVTISALPVNSPDIYTVDFWVKGQLVKTFVKPPYTLTITPVEPVTVAAVATDYAGNTAAPVSIVINTVPNNPPTVSIVSPTNNSLASTSGTVTVRAQATDDLGLKEIELRVISTDLSLTQVYPLSGNVLTSTHDFSFAIPSTALPGHDIRVEVVSRDVRGLQSTVASITLKTADKTLPVVKITSFNQGFHIKPGERIPVTVYAMDNWAISRVDFRTEGGMQLSETMIVDPPSYDAIAQFYLTVPVGYAGGTKITVAPSATDLAGNVGYAARITLVTDDTTPPVVTIASPSSGSNIMSRSTVKVSATASDNDALDRVEFYINGQLFATSKYLSGGTYNGSFITPATAGKPLTLSARAFDSAGNGSEIQSITLNIISDNVPPAITMASNPLSLRFTEGHNTSVSFYASDNIVVSSIDLLVNNAVVSTLRNPSPSIQTFNYLVGNMVPQGLPSVKAPLEIRAYDADGNQATSGVYQIDVFRDNAPTVTVQSPQNLQNVIAGGRIHIEATASDDFGVKSMEVKVNGVSIKTSSGAAISADFNVPLDLAQSQISIEVLATDTLDKAGSKTVSVNVPLSIRKVSEVITGGEAIDLAMYGGYAYLLEKGSVISVLDLRDVSTASKVGGLTLQGSYTGIDSYEGLIFAFGTDGVTLIDPSSPAAPVAIASFKSPAAVTDIAFRMGHAYAGMGSSGLLVLDIHDPSRPLGKVITGINAQRVSIDGDNLIVSSGSANPSLSVYSLSQPRSPLSLWTYNASSVTAFNAAGASGIGITAGNKISSFGLSSGAGISKLADLTPNPSAAIKGIDTLGRYTFTSSGTAGWNMIEGTGAGLYDLGNISAGGNTSRVVFNRGYVFTVDGTAGLKIYRVESADATVPTVQIKSPLSGSSVSKGAEVELQVEVTGSDPAAVTFSIDGREVYTDTTQPYAFRFSVPANASTLVVKAGAIGLNGIYAESPEVTLNVTDDAVASTVTITTPAPGTTPVLFEGETLHVKGSAQDNLGVAVIELYVDGIFVDYTLSSVFDFTYTVPNDGLLNNTDYLSEVTVRVTDVSGNVTESKFNLHVIQDNPPVVTSLSTLPASGLTANSLITLIAAATDDRGIKDVKFYDGDTLLGAGTLSGGQYLISYRVPAVTRDGETRTLRARATDTAGLTGETAITITIVMDKVLPVVTMVSDLAAMRFTEGHNANITVTAIDNIGVASLELRVNNKVVSTINNPAYNSLTFAYLVESLITSGMSSVRVPLEVRATDLNGNIGTSGTYTIEVFPDNPPSVAILSPLPGQNVIGGASIRLEARSSDDFGVVSMELKAGGISLAKVYAASISADYKVPSAAFGSSLVLEAIATDTLGHSISSLIDLNVPMRVSQVSTISTGAEIIDVAYYSGYVFALEKDIGLSVIDVRNPSSPGKIAVLPLQGSFTSLRMFEGVAYIYGPEGLTLVDVLDPAAPVVLDMFVTNYPVLDISFRNGYAYCAMGAGGLMILDVHDPQDISTVAP
ncbi:MAG: Ig-like domain-containing protein [Nitrospirae bacterium]|nr:Ig-like domain-containing protein [Nitrospirota bacterium]